VAKLDAKASRVRRRPCDPTNPFSSPNSSLPTAFTILTGSSNQFVIGTSMQPIAGYQFSVNTPTIGRRQGQFRRLAIGHRLMTGGVSRLMSASLLKRRDCCAHAKRREGPEPDAAQSSVAGSWIRPISRRHLVTLLVAEIGRMQLFSSCHAPLSSEHPY
jgi:hypothetical protein